MMKLHVLASLILVVCVSHVVAASLELFHSLDGGATWSVAGTLDGSIKGGDVTLVRAELDASDRRKLQTLADKDQMYLVRVGPVASTAIRASCWASAPTTEALSLALAGGEVTGIQYTVDSPTCGSQTTAGASVQLPGTTLPVSVVGASMGPGLLWDKAGAYRGVAGQAPVNTGSAQQRVGNNQGGGPTNRPLGGMPNEGAEGQAGGEQQQPKPEQTWLQKNWLFILGGVMLVMNAMSAIARNTQQGQQPAPAARR